MITVKQPPINPVPGHYVNYTIYSHNETVDMIYGWAKLTYQSYKTPTWVNVSMEQQTDEFTDSYWTLLNVMNRQFEDGNATWLFWIETDIQLGDDIQLADTVARVIDSGIIDAAGSTRECWILESVQPEWNGTWFGFDKETGILLYIEVVRPEEGEMNFTLTSTNIFSLEWEVTQELKVGWNLIGMPFTDTFLEEIFAHTLAHVEAIYGYWNGSWSYWLPGVSSTLTRLECGMGYWVKADTPFAVTLNGTVDEAPPMCTGWNLVAVNSTEPLPVEDYVAGEGGVHP